MREKGIRAENAIERELRDIGDDFVDRARSYLDAKIYSQPRRWEYQRTGRLRRSVRTDESRLPFGISILAGGRSNRGTAADYAIYVEFKHFRHAGDLSYMSPTYQEFVEGANGIEPVEQRIREALIRA